jgi:aromatic-L-amino-acid decarboxylase
MKESPLELSGDDFRAMVAHATTEIVRHVASLPTQTLHATGGGKALARSLRERLPETGTDYKLLLTQLVRRVVPRSFNTASPGYLAYIPGGGLLHSAVADLVASAVNRYVGVWVAAPGLAQIESNVVRWFCEIVGYAGDPTPGGMLTTGGSMSNLIAIVTARENLLGEDFGQGVLYVSDQAHHSIAKAARFAGFRRDQVSVIPSDERFRMNAGLLAERIEADVRAGKTPCMIVASAGTTNTGAIDDLPRIAELAARHRLWLHVDAAYGGFFALTARGKRALAGLERADSITLDPHKSLFLPYGTGALVVRAVERLRNAHAMQANYMPPMQSDDDFTDFCDLGPELSRDFRGLRVWLPIKMHGAAVFRAALDEKLELAASTCEAIRAMPHIEIMAEPELSLFAFRVGPSKGVTGAALDALNRRVLRKVNSRQRVFLTGTVVRGMFVLRVCVLSFRTHADRMEMFLEDLRGALAGC